MKNYSTQIGKRPVSALGRYAREPTSSRLTKPPARERPCRHDINPRFRIKQSGYKSSQQK
jgi:hypothetical protein